MSDGTARIAIVGGDLSRLLLGVAASASPPIGQGVNAPMESAMTLDLCGGEAGHSPTDLVEDAKSAEIPYSVVRGKAGRLWPLWA